MEHIISDAFSLNILIRELGTAYFDALEGRPFSLPAVQTQFPDYAAWQRKRENSWIEKHGSYWAEHLAGFGRLRFPVDNTVPALRRVGWDTVPVRIGKGLREELQRCCRSNQTTLAMSVFAAYAGLVLRWCGASEAVFPYQTDGRFNGETENTIGYFAAVLYLRIALQNHSSFLDLVRHATEEYCRAYDHADLSYIDAQMQQPEFTLHSGFNWVPEQARFEARAAARSTNAISTYPIADKNPAFDNLDFDCEPCILLFDFQDEVVGSISFPLNRFSAETMARFSGNLLKLVTEMIRQPGARVTEITLT